LEKGTINVTIRFAVIGMPAPAVPLFREFHRV
jgi:hypothetical protein